MFYRLSFVSLKIYSQDITEAINSPGIQYPQILAIFLFFMTDFVFFYSAVARVEEMEQDCVYEGTGRCSGSSVTFMRHV